MAIQFDKEHKVISLHTKGSTYQMQIGRYGHLLHLYYGRRLEGDAAYLLTFYDRGFSANPYEARLDKTYSLDALPQEYACYGSGDFRSSAFEIADAQGVYGCDLRYQGHEILDGKYAIPKLPAVYCEDAQRAQTLVVRLADERLPLVVELYYGVIEELDVITRTVCEEYRGCTSYDREGILSNAGFCRRAIRYPAFSREARERASYGARRTYGRKAVLREPQRSEQPPAQSLCDSRGEGCHGGVRRLLRDGTALQREFCL